MTDIKNRIRKFENPPTNKTNSYVKTPNKQTRKYQSLSPQPYSRSNYTTNKSKTAQTTKTTNKNYPYNRYNSNYQFQRSTTSTKRTQTTKNVTPSKSPKYSSAYGNKKISPNTRYINTKNTKQNTYKSKLVEPKNPSLSLQKRSIINRTRNTQNFSRNNLLPTTHLSSGSSWKKKGKKWENAKKAPIPIKTTGRNIDTSPNISSTNKSSNIRNKKSYQPIGKTYSLVKKYNSNLNRNNSSNTSPIINSKTKNKTSTKTFLKPQTYTKALNKSANTSPNRNLNYKQKQKQNQYRSGKKTLDNTKKKNGVLSRWPPANNQIQNENENENGNGNGNTNENKNETRNEIQNENENTTKNRNVNKNENNSKSNRKKNNNRTNKNDQVDNKQLENSEQRRSLSLGDIKKKDISIGNKKKKPTKKNNLPKNYYLLDSIRLVQKKIHINDNYFENLKIDNSSNGNDAVIDLLQDSLKENRRRRKTTNKVRSRIKFGITSRIKSKKKMNNTDNKNKDENEITDQTTNTKSKINTKTKVNTQTSTSKSTSTSTNTNTQSNSKPKKQRVSVKVDELDLQTQEEDDFLYDHQDDPKGIAICDYTATKESELSFKKGETIFIIGQAESGWWQGETRTGIGIFRSNLIKKENEKENENNNENQTKVENKNVKENNPNQNSNKKPKRQRITVKFDELDLQTQDEDDFLYDHQDDPKGIAICDYTSKKESELSFKKGETIFIIGQAESGWWQGETRTGIGIFRANLIKMVDENEKENENKIKNKNEKKNNISTQNLNPNTNLSTNPNKKTKRKRISVKFDDFELLPQDEDDFLYDHQDDPKGIAICDYTSKKESELSFKKGETIFIIGQAESGWWQGETRTGIGIFRSDLIKMEGENAKEKEYEDENEKKNEKSNQNEKVNNLNQNQNPKTNPNQKRKRITVKFDDFELLPQDEDDFLYDHQDDPKGIAICDYTSKKESELSFKKGETIFIIGQAESGWWQGETRTGIGIFRADLIKMEGDNAKEKENENNNENQTKVENQNEKKNNISTQNSNSNTNKTKRQRITVKFDDFELLPQDEDDFLYDHQDDPKGIAICDYTSKKESELSFKKGETIFIIGQAESGWWQGETRTGIGIFRANLIKMVDENENEKENENNNENQNEKKNQNEKENNPNQNSNKKPKRQRESIKFDEIDFQPEDEDDFLYDHQDDPKGIAICDYTSKKESELSFKKGETIFIIGQTESGWWQGETRTGIGIFRADLIKMVDENENVGQFNDISAINFNVKTATTTTTTTTNEFNDNQNKMDVSQKTQFQYGSNIKVQELKSVQENKEIGKTKKKVRVSVEVDEIDLNRPDEHEGDQKARLKQDYTDPINIDFKFAKNEIIYVFGEMGDKKVQIEKKNGENGTIPISIIEFIDDDENVITNPFESKFL
ncbi:dynamin-binding protein [Anaeramoeba flamelloides]|uniref:Dynamin-binding protein n=1 Tax=Anaeramoeba flamelloides TaxID=1746091 RepID=A0AAV8AD53_9EUKA|nr:dynamin-binding protein [Anaeramoeba flamelloides]